MESQVSPPGSSPVQIALRYWWIWWACGAILVVIVVVLSLMPNPPVAQMRHLDKLEHFLGYAMLMGWFCQLYRGARAFAILGLVFVSLGVAVEVAQGMTGHRHYDPVDMVANTLGVIAGWASRLVLPRLFLGVESWFTTLFVSRGG